MSSKKINKPKCECGKEMIVEEFIGYYDTFKYWEFADDCECGRKLDIDDFDADETSKGAYAH